MAELDIQDFLYVKSYSIIGILFIMLVANTFILTSKNKGIPVAKILISTLGTTAFVFIINAIIVIIRN
ncbi:hypothetical protein PV403_24445 [Paenibacillus sp. GYB006]|uniref:hypothetical protein n=1 Tax=Paenibacillus sp. GYB006 TaxID=2994394 RepID=UPI002F96BDD1